MSETANSSATSGWSSRVDQLADELEIAVERTLFGDGPTSLLYSGGIDSSIIGWVARRLAPIELVAVGTAGSFDLDQATSGARLLGLGIRRVTVEPAEIHIAANRWLSELEGLTEPARSVGVTMALGLESVPPGRVLCGQGADELFLGYAHFRGLSSRDATRRREEDLAALVDREWPRAVRMGQHIGRDLRSPYLDLTLVRSVLSGPIDEHLPVDQTKPVLRAIARRLGLPEPLISRPKRAMQYGSGVHQVLQRRTNSSTARA